MKKFLVLILLVLPLLMLDCGGGSSESTEGTEPPTGPPSVMPPSESLIGTYVLTGFGMTLISTLTGPPTDNIVWDETDFEPWSGEMYITEDHMLQRQTWHGDDEEGMWMKWYFVGPGNPSSWADGEIHLGDTEPTYPRHVVFHYKAAGMFLTLYHLNIDPANGYNAWYFTPAIPFLQYNLPSYLFPISGPHTEYGNKYFIWKKTSNSDDWQGK